MTINPDPAIRQRTAQGLSEMESESAFEPSITREKFDAFLRDSVWGNLESNKQRQIKSDQEKLILNEILLRRVAFERKHLYARSSAYPYQAQPDYTDCL
jgi:hypothetical protein